MYRTFNVNQVPFVVADFRLPNGQAPPRVFCGESHSARRQVHMTLMSARTSALSSFTARIILSKPSRRVSLLVLQPDY